MSGTSTDREISVAMPLMAGFSALLIALGILGVWGTGAQISGSVLAMGRLELVQGTYVVSHPTGGLVADVRYRNGSFVQAGEIVVVFDGTRLTSELVGVTEALSELLVQQARQRAEATRAGDLVIDPRLAALTAEQPDIEDRIAEERRRLVANREAVDRQIALEETHIQGIDEQIAGLHLQLAAVRAERDAIVGQVATSRDLQARGLATDAAVIALERDKLRTDSTIAGVESAIAELGVRRIQRTIEIEAVRDRDRLAAVSALEDLATLIADRAARRNELILELQKLEVRAPVSGVVHDSRVLGVGSVIGPGAPIMTLVPESSEMAAVVRVEAFDVDQVFDAQEAAVQFQAFHSRDIPILLGKIESVSADVVLDPLTKRPFYEVRIKFPENELAKLGNREIANGMLVAAFLTTTPQTPLEYLLNPISRFAERSMRDR
jgi:HlyD family secretion protein